MKLPAVSFNFNTYDQLILDIPGSRLAEVIRLLKSLPSPQIGIELFKPHKPRTTGKGSQSAHFNGHVQQICQETGNDFETVKMYIKTKAISRGYPFDTLGDLVVPWSESRSDTTQCAILIETAHQVAAELDIQLIETSS